MGLNSSSNNANAESNLDLVGLSFLCNIRHSGEEVGFGYCGTLFESCLELWKAQ